MIGFTIEQAQWLPTMTVPTMLTAVQVNGDDEAFAHPSKFIGPGYSATEARELEAQRHWTFALDGERLRRVVPSPKPVSIFEIEAVRTLLAAGYLVICAGGGGVLVIRDREGRIQALCA